CRGGIPAVRPVPPVPRPPPRGHRGRRARAPAHPARRAGTRAQRRSHGDVPCGGPGARHHAVRPRRADRRHRGRPRCARPTGSSARGRRRQRRGLAAMTLLQCAGLEVSYGRNHVLHGVDLTLAAGEVLAVLGTNGAGKSTLLRAISGLTPPRQGRITLDGHDVTGSDPMKMARAGLAYMPGGRGIFPDLTVGDNLRMATWVGRADKAHCARAIDRTISLFPALRGRLEERAGLLSGGQQQMLALAQALIQGPPDHDGHPGTRVLLIDELSLGLAPAIVAELL